VPSFRQPWRVKTPGFSATSAPSVPWSLVGEKMVGFTMKQGDFTTVDGRNPKTTTWDVCIKPWEMVGYTYL